ncbi:hypothetical protein CR513_54915, partial [Mucuna pruriens]
MFATEAVIPVEIGEPSMRTTLFEQSKNEDELRANLDMETAHIREYAVKTRVAKMYNESDPLHLQTPGLGAEKSSSKSQKQ